MDSHYFQVMKAREAITDTTPRLYFAYSTILDRAAFETWRKEHSYESFDLPQGKLAEAIGIDLLYDFPSRWWGGRVAGLKDNKDSKIYGLVFEIPAKDWPIIQHKEGGITGMSVERSVRVLVDGKEVEATAFTTSPGRASTDGAISPRFVEALINGAEQAGLPKAYIQKLKTSAV